jgi:hypothetical protein
MIDEESGASLALDALKTATHVSEPEPALKYIQAYVLYVDFLGFTDIVAKTRQQSKNHEQGLIEKIREALYLPVPEKENSVPSGLGFDGKTTALRYATTFSDFTIAVADPTPLGLVTLAKLGADVSNFALTKGFACRGGLALAEVYCEEGESSGNRGIVFGPAFLDAYYLEHNNALGARIVLSNSAADAVCNLPEGCPLQAKEYLTRLIDQAGDGPFKLNPFALLNPIGAKERLKEIKLSLETMLEKYTESPRVYKKLADLAQEFNKHFEDTDDLKVDVRRKRH